MRINPAPFFRISNNDLFIPGYSALSQQNCFKGDSVPQIFPPSANKWPPITFAGFAVLLVSAVGFFWYYGSPEYTDVGYRPVQPVPYDHQLHAGDLGIDCRYCHVSVEQSGVANVPPTQTCMNCHTIIKAESEKLAMIRNSYSSRMPVEWIKIHKLPDYVYFNHSAHIRAGVGCESCHGNIASMQIVSQSKPLSMSWCLDCHRDPVMHLRPAHDITVMGWTPPANQREMGSLLRQTHKINPPEDCSGCHR